jgi:hypothetical protein
MLDMVVHICNPSYSEGRDRRMESLKTDQAKLLKPPSKKQNLKIKWLRDMLQEIECLKSEVLGSVLSMKNKYKNKTLILSKLINRFHLIS